MHPRLNELLAYLDAQDQNLRAAFDLVPVELRVVRPSPDRWSAVEIVHHLLIVERRLVPLLASLIERAGALPPEGDEASLFPMPMATRIAIRGRRLKTFEANEPRDTDPARVWDDYRDTRAALKQMIVTADGLSLGAVTAPHPLLGDFTAYEWIAFAGAHAARHADQIREMTVSLA